MVAALGSIAGGVLGGLGTEKAAQAQAQAIKLGIATQRAQHNTTSLEFAPYQSAGLGALQQIQDLLGIGGSSASSGADTAGLVNYLSTDAVGKSGKRMQKWLQANPNATPDQQLAAIKALADPHELGELNAYAAANPYRPGTPGTPQQAQQASIDALKASPAFTSLYGTGQDAILQNAAATGGLRGGNTNNSLAQFGSSLLAQVIQQQLGNLGGLSGAGLNATTSLAADSQKNADQQQAGFNALGSTNAVGTGGVYGAAQGTLNQLIAQLSGGGANSLGNFFGGGAGVSAFGNNAINSMGTIPINIASGGF